MFANYIKVFSCLGKFAALVLLLFLFSSCNTIEEPEIPDHIQGLDNLIIITNEETPVHRIHFTKEVEFGVSVDPLIGGLGSFTVDEDNRVYLGDTQQQRIYIFDSNGQYKEFLGKQGRGPGEFQHAGYLKIVDQLLFAFDPLQFRINVFFTGNFELNETIPLKVRNKRDFDGLGNYELGFMHPLTKDRFLGIFSTPVIYPDPSHPNYNLNDRTKLFYLIDDTGTIISDKLFEYPTYRALTATVNGEYRNTQFKFLGHTLISVSNDPEIYVARTEDFLVKVYDMTGQYVRAFYYPFQKKAFTREAAIHQQEREYEGDGAVLEWRTSVIRHAPEEQIPPFWPALNDLLVDDKNRIWVSTIADNQEEYEWWILDALDGTLLARFYWPVDKSIEEVRNGKIYVRETENETGLEKIVRYDIVLRGR
jgi:hypothetical protein